MFTDGLTTYDESLIPAALPVAYLLFVGLNWGVLPVIALGLVYWPMSMVAGALFQSPMAILNVPLVVRAIRGAGGEYLMGVAVIYGLVLISAIIQLTTSSLLPFLVAMAITQCIALYSMMVEMYLLGRVYRNHDRKIG